MIHAGIHWPTLTQVRASPISTKIWSQSSLNSLVRFWISRIILVLDLSIFSGLGPWRTGFGSWIPGVEVDKVFQFRWTFWTCQTSFGIELWPFVTLRRLLILGPGPKPETEPEVEIKSSNQFWKSIMSRSSQLFFKESCLDKSSWRKIRSRLEGKGLWRHHDVTINTNGIIIWHQRPWRSRPD